MRNFRKVLMIGLASLPLSVQAMASTVTGPYVSGGGGYDLTQTQHATFSPGSYGNGVNLGRGSSSVRHQNGYTGFGAFGWGFGNGLRAEVEGDYFYSQINHVNKSAGVNRAGGGDRNYGAFVNVIYDIDLKKHFGIDSPVTPYVGVGAGYLWSAERQTNINFASGQTTHLSGSVGSFGYQGIVGASYDVDAVPGLAVFADYRMVGQDFENGAHGVQSNGPMGHHSGHVNFDQRFNHQFNLGIRYAFNSAPPAPVEAAPIVAPPQVIPARTYLVFFDWDKSELTARARQIVAEAASSSTHVQTTRIEVNGYADNSSARGGVRGEAYNQALSMRRANAVKAEMVRDGVPASEIDIRAYGQTNQLVATGPNTREPQNRRVEIILH